MSARNLSLLFLLLALLCYATQADDLMTSWTVRVDNYSESVEINCTRDANNTTVTVFHWILPDLILLRPNTSTPLHPRIRLTEDGYILNISRVEAENIGPYMCYFRGPTGEEQYTRMIVYRYEPSAWELYQTNVIIGIVAAAVMLFLSVSFCVVNYFRWQPQSAGGIAPAMLLTTSAYPNNAYDGQAGAAVATIRSDKSGVTVVSIETPGSRTTSPYGARVDGFTHM